MDVAAAAAAAASNEPCGCERPDGRLWLGGQASGRSSHKTVEPHYIWPISRPARSELSPAWRPKVISRPSLLVRP